MNTRSLNPSLIRHLSIVTVGLSLAFALAASGVEKTNPPSAASQHTTNSTAKPAPIEIPVSQFVIPTAVADGRNPFFPESTQMIKTPVVNTNTLGKPAAVALVLQGISGTEAKRFALINGRTFEAGEEGDVTAGKSKVHIHCITIREDGVTVDADGTRQELKMRPGL